MSNELIIKKCLKCGALIKVLNDCNCGNCGFECCGEKMTVLEANTFDAAVEKHVPTYEKSGDEIFVKVNHPMEKEHFIEWISLVKDEKESFVKLYPEQDAETIFPYMPGSTIYAFCNKHQLWKKDVE